MAVGHVDHGGDAQAPVGESKNSSSKQGDAVFYGPAEILPAALPAVLRSAPAMWSKIAPRSPGQARPRQAARPSTPGFLKLNGRIHPVSDDDARACWRISTWANSFRCGDHGRYRKHQLLPLHLARRICIDAVRGADARAAAVLYRADAPAGRTRHPGAAAADPARRHAPDDPARQALRHRHAPTGRLRTRARRSALRTGRRHAGPHPSGRPGLPDTPAQSARAVLVAGNRPQGHALPGRRPGPPAVDGIGRTAGRQRHRVLAKPALGSCALRPVPR